MKYVKWLFVSLLVAVSVGCGPSFERAPIDYSLIDAEADYIEYCSEVQSKDSCECGAESIIVGYTNMYGSNRTAINLIINYFYNHTRGVDTNRFPETGEGGVNERDAAILVSTDAVMDCYEQDRLDWNTPN